MKTLREICRGIVKTFGIVRDVDKKIASNMATAMRINVEQMKEYEKRFEPGPPGPDPIQEATAQAGIDVTTIANALQEFADTLHRPEPLSHLANNWRKMHGLPMRRKRRRR